MKKYLITLIIFLGFYGVSSALSPVKVAIVSPGATGVPIEASVVDYDGPTTMYTQTPVGTFEADENGIISFLVGAGDPNWDAVNAANIDGSWVLNIYAGGTLYAQYRLDQLIFGQSSGLMNVDGDGNLIPDNEEQSLGTDENRWSDIYIGDSTVHIGVTGNEATVYYITDLSELQFAINGTEQVAVSPTTTTFNGNVDATNGLDVTGANLTVGSTNINPASGDLMMGGDIDLAQLGNVITNSSGNEVVIDDTEGLLVDNGPTTLNDGATVNIRLISNGLTELRGNVDIGDAASDDITVNGEIVSNVIPRTDDAHDLGSDAKRWSNVYVNGGSVHVGPTDGAANSTEMALGYNLGTNTGSIEVDGVSVMEITDQDVNLPNVDLDIGNGNFTVDNVLGNAHTGGFISAGITTAADLTELAAAETSVIAYTGGDPILNTNLPSGPSVPDGAVIYLINDQGVDVLGKTGYAAGDLVVLVVRSGTWYATN